MAGVQYLLDQCRYDYCLELCTHDAITVFNRTCWCKKNFFFVSDFSEAAVTIIQSSLTNVYMKGFLITLQCSSNVRNALLTWCPGLTWLGGTMTGCCGSLPLRVSTGRGEEFTESVLCCTLCHLILILDVITGQGWEPRLDWSQLYFMWHVLMYTR